MSYRYLLSIIIPTRNRQTYLLCSLREILEVIPDCIQIVIQDNSDNDQLRNESYMSYTNVKYNYQAGVLSFVDNFDKAISLADGEYVCIIGDDDGVTDEIYNVAKWASQNQVDSVIPAIDFEYFYPKSINLYNMESNGIMRLLCERTLGYYFDSYEGVKQLLLNGCVEYMNYDLVKLYHGIVKYDRLLDVKKITGRFVGGLTPDIYNAVSLSLVCKKNIMIKYPLTIAGVCAKSGSANSSNGLHVGRYEDAPHLVGNDSYEWSAEVPKFYSVETIWADSALAAVKDMKQDQLLDLFSRNKLERYCSYKFGNYKDKYINNVDNYKESIINKLINFPVSEFAHKIKRRIMRVNKKLVISNNIKDVYYANMEFANYKKSYLREKNMIQTLNSIKNEIA